MKENNTIQIQELTSDEVKDQIYTIRSVQVMLDSDLAKIYGYETKNFNRQVKNNIDRFPEDMMFQLTSEEVRYISRCKNFTSIIQTSGIKGGRVYLPYVFTEQGIYMLMTVLKGELAIKQSLALVRIFKQMKDYLTDNSHLFKHLQDIDLRLSVHDKNFQKIFKKLESPKEKKAFVFSAGQLWDAASCLEDIFRKANKNITVIDKYVDKQTLDLLSKKSPGVSVTLVTDSMGVLQN